MLSSMAEQSWESTAAVWNQFCAASLRSARSCRTHAVWGIAPSSSRQPEWKPVLPWDTSIPSYILLWTNRESVEFVSGVWIDITGSTACDPWGRRQSGTVRFSQDLFISWSTNQTDWTSVRLSVCPSIQPARAALHPLVNKTRPSLF